MENNWISAKDRTPDFDGKYLCFIKQPQDCNNVWGFQSVLNLSMNKWQKEDERDVVTHWQPLPSAPHLAKQSNGI